MFGGFWVGSFCQVWAQGGLAVRMVQVREVSQRFLP